MIGDYFNLLDIPGQGLRAFEGEKEQQSTSEGRRASEILEMTFCLNVNESGY